MKLIGWCAQIIGPMLMTIYNAIQNYGLSIIILTLFIRTIMIPLYIKQMRYSAQMAEIAPQVNEIQKKYARNKDKANYEIEKLYRENNVKATSGCLPLIVQMPFIMGLFTLLRAPLEYMGSYPYMVSAVHESFLWISDLCQPDPWVLPIVAAITTYFAFGVGSATDTTGSMNAMKYAYPVIILLMARTFPSGLALYWAIGNVFTIAQTLLFNNKKKKDAFKKKAEEEVRKARREKENN